MHLILFNYGNGIPTYSPSEWPLVCVYWPIGFRVSNATFNAIVMRYTDKDGHVKFNDFVAAYIKLKTLFGKNTASRRSAAVYLSV